MQNQEKITDFIRLFPSEHLSTALVMTTHIEARDALCRNCGQVGGGYINTHYPPTWCLYRHPYWALSVMLHKSNRHQKKKQLAVSMHVCQQAFVWPRAEEAAQVDFHYSA